MMSKGKHKVFSGLAWWEGEQVGLLVATTSQRMCAEIAKESLHRVRYWWTVTGNEEDVAFATKHPGVRCLVLGKYSKDKKYIVHPDDVGKESR